MLKVHHPTACFPSIIDHSNTKETVMPKRKDFETSLPRETEQRELPSAHETHAFNDILQHAQAFSTESTIDAPESSSNKWPFSEKAKVPISEPSIRLYTQYLLETGPFSPEVKEKHKAATKAALNRPEVQAKRIAAFKATMNRPEVKEKHKAAIKAAMNRPEVHAKCIAAMNRPEVQAKRIATLANQKLEGTGRFSQKESRQPEGFEITWYSSPGEGIMKWFAPEN
jgi:hypothetical protein